MNHYDVLGVSRDATQEDIKRAYRNLARRHHPDANPGDQAAVERFKEVGRAYEVLSDPGKRQRYDMFGDDGARATVDFSDFGGVSDLFSSFFGGGVRSRSGPARGADIVAQVELTLEEAAWGVEREIEITTLRECSECSGSGAAPGTFPSRCPDCGGSGELRQVRRGVRGPGPRRGDRAGHAAHTGGGGRRRPAPGERSRRIWTPRGPVGRSLRRHSHHPPRTFQALG